MSRLGDLKKKRDQLERRTTYEAFAHDTYDLGDELARRYRDSYLNELKSVNEEIAREEKRIASTPGEVDTSHLEELKSKAEKYQREIDNFDVDTNKLKRDKSNPHANIDFINSEIVSNEKYKQRWKEKLESVRKEIQKEEQRLANLKASHSRPSSVSPRTRHDDYARDRRRRDDERFLAERDRRERRERAHEKWHRDLGSSHGPDCPYGGRY